jgi:Ca2+:H+ antiporter
MRSNFLLASIAAQTNYIIGAFLNAGFGTIVEVLLYVMALKKGKLDTLVQYGVTGALLSNMLLLPGLSMIAGGFKYKEQRFNPSAAGVSSVMLLVSVLGAFTPTIFYTIYGNHSLNCSLCTTASHNSTMDLSCKVCVYEQVSHNHIHASKCFNNDSNSVGFGRRSYVYCWCQVINSD